jgi:hypothetical protein
MLRSKVDFILAFSASADITLAWRCHRRARQASASQGLNHYKDINIYALFYLSQMTLHLRRMNHFQSVLRGR